MKRKILFIVGILSTVFSVAASFYSTIALPRHCVILPVDVPQTSNSDNELLWRQVDSLVSLGLPKSALAIVNTIYQQSNDQKDDPQLVKAILYRIRLQSDFQEDAPANAIREIEREIAFSREPVTRILYSVAGELYWNFLLQNQYRFRNRTPLIYPSSDNIDTWDLNMLTYHIILCYRNSLSDEILLQSIPVKQFSAILEEPGSDQPDPDSTGTAKWTLFDFLATRALRFFTSQDIRTTTSSQSFRPDNTAFFSLPSRFVSYPLQPQGIHALPGTGPFVPPGIDTLALPWYALRIYQALAAFHLNDKDPELLITQELHRFSYVLRESTLPDKDSLYLDALRQFEQAYKGFSSSTEISYALAQKLMEEGANYNPLLSGDHKWSLKSAMEVCQKAVGLYPDATGSKNCNLLVGQILAPSLQVTGEYAIIPDQPALVSVSYKNITHLYFRMLKTDPDLFQPNLAGLPKEDVFKYLAGLNIIDRWATSLPTDGDHQEHRTEVKIPPVMPGFYIIFSSADSAFLNPAIPFTWQAVWSSHISYISRRDENGGISVYLLDRESGKTLKNLPVEAFSRTYDPRARIYVTSRAGEYRSDESGYFTISPPGGSGIYSNLFFKIRDDHDLLITEPVYIYPVSKNPVRPVEQTLFFTDRAIYRPGQTIYFKGIILERTGDSTSLKPNKTTRITFVDVNGQKIADQSFTTSAYGAFNGSFTAPAGILTGEMRIFNESGSIGISVEEYKRPTFEIIFDPVEGNYKLGELVGITGKATGYAGNAIDGGTVSYRVVRSAHFPFRDLRWYCPVPVSPELEICNGTVSTRTDGSFTFTFQALPDLTISQSTKPVFDFYIYADVTDINGETRSAQEVLSVGYTSLLININLPEKMNLQAGGIYSVSATNLNGRPTPAQITVKLQKLTPPDRIFIDRLWERPDTPGIPKGSFYALFPHYSYEGENNPSAWPVESTVFEKIVNTATDSLINLTDTGYEIRGRRSGLRDPGSYKLILSSTDPFGQLVEKTLYFTAFDPDSKQVPVPEMNWFVPLTVSGEPGETASFLIGSGEKDVQVIWEIRSKDQVISRNLLKISGQQKRVDIPITEEYRGNFSVNFLFVRCNRVFQNTQVVSVPYSNKHLDMTFSSFRNKLMPGQKETWNIRITRPDGKGADAELLATMYDRSLDIFRSNTWGFDLFRHYYFTNAWDVQDDFRTTGGSWYAPSQAGWAFQGNVDPSLNWFGLNLMQGSYSMNADLKTGRQELAALPQGDASLSTGKDVTEQQQPEPEIQNIPVCPLRKDFRETAFFYPSLVTDSTGNLLLSFTVPEALTSWKILGLAYTKSLDYGLIEKELITRKELMVFPNVPRFLRQGDTLVFSTRIVNLANHEVSGVARLNLNEAVSRESLNSMILDSGYGKQDTGYRRRSFSLPAGQSTTVSWTLAIPVSKYAGLLQYQVYAQAADYSDGEENVVPILPVRMLVTESMPLPVSGKGTFLFNFDKLLASGKEPPGTLSNYKLTLEFASNPAWYAVQALPALDEVIYKNADQVFAAFYANCLASYIAGSNPKIRQVFESWKMLTPDALLSQLEKNEELKSVVLEETPWVMDAEGETGNRRKLGQFFDLNNLQDHFRKNVATLTAMQYPSGGWPWFEGMSENRIITLNILTGLGRLNHLGVGYMQHEDSFSGMVRRAVVYLDKELVRDYEQVKKSFPSKLNENHLGPVQVKYMYARSFFSFPLSEEGYAEAFQYYRDQAARYWPTLNLASQAMVALALYRLGDKTIPVQILKSLSERAVHSPEMGMYWVTRSSFEWYRAPVETQAALIEAFDEIGHDPVQVEEMKVWLLKQKQTQMWRTKQGTVDACYALLLRGANLLANDPGVIIRLGDEEINPDELPDLRREAGTGYFRMSWTGHEVKPEMGEIRVTKMTEGIAWGGLYWQYLENLDKITPHETPLKVERQLFLERNTEAGPALVPISTFEFPLSNDSLSYQLTSFPAHRLTIGDKLRVRIVLTVDRLMEFVHMKDLRAAGLEPIPTPRSPQLGRRDSGEGLSGYRYQDGLGYYQSTTDVATNFFFDYLPKGTYVFEYPLIVNIAGDFSTAITTVQCMYAPGFSAHSEGSRIEVGK